MRVAEELRGTGFEWGKADCATVAMHCINAMYPEPVLNAHIGSLRDAKALADPEAVKAILDAGSASELPRMMATCGDLLVGEGDDPDGFPAFGVLLRGGRMITSSREKGVVFDRTKGTEDFRAYRTPQ